MALPLPRVVSDVGPGGPLITSMNGINSLANNNLLRQMNAIKQQYLPTTMQAEAASKLAYANLMGPQFLAKIMGNDSALANMSENQKRSALDKIYSAGSGQNALNQMGAAGIGQPSTNSISGWIANKFKNAFETPANKNSLAKNYTQNTEKQFQGIDQGRGHQEYTPNQEDPINHEIDAAFMEWLKSPEGQAELAKGEQANMPSEKEVLAWKRQKDGNFGAQIGSEQRNKQYDNPTYAENTGFYKGTVKEGEELGKHRAQSINDIGEQQMNLSASGANLDRLINDINDPKFMALRNEIPFFQDTQLKALSKLGTPEQQEMIGNFIADAKSFAGATVNSFKGQTMKREFDYADQLKPTENDTVSIIRGKLNALKSLKEIAEQKNNIILDLMQEKHMNLGNAVKSANKMIDIRAIDNQVKKLSEPLITIKNPKTGEKKTVSLSEARKLGVPNV